MSDFLFLLPLFKELALFAFYGTVVITAIGFVLQFLTRGFRALTDYSDGKMETDTDT